MQLIFTIDEFRALVHLLHEHENDEQEGQERGAMSRKLRLSGAPLKPFRHLGGVSFGFDVQYPEGLPINAKRHLYRQIGCCDHELAGVRKACSPPLVEPGW